VGRDPVDHARNAEQHLSVLAHSSKKRLGGLKHHVDQISWRGGALKEVRDQDLVPEPGRHFVCHKPDIHKFPAENVSA
jgi:hypothetical protein